MSAPVQTAVQIAWVTPSLEATEKALTATLGAKKWIRMADVHFAPDACTHRGSPADFFANISLSYLGDMQLELIQPVTGESVYSEFLHEYPSGGLHHIAVEEPDPDHFDAALATAAAAGTDIICQGTMPGGMRFAYLSNPAAGVPYLEIAYVPDEIKSFYDYIKQEQQ